jgi:hypothetical protein
VIIVVYACPTPGCGNYFGSSSSGDMAEVMGQSNGNFEPRPESSWFKRVECPDCRQRGKKVERVRVEFETRTAV